MRRAAAAAGLALAVAAAWLLRSADVDAQALLTTPGVGPVMRHALRAAGLPGLDTLAPLDPVAMAAAFAAQAAAVTEVGHREQAMMHEG